MGYSLKNVMISMRLVQIALYAFFPQKLINVHVSLVLQLPAILYHSIFVDMLVEINRTNINDTRKYITC